MKKKSFVSMVIMAALCVACLAPVVIPATAQAQGVVSLDLAFDGPAAYNTTNDLSNTLGQEPLFLKAWGLVPTNGTVTITLRHTDANGTVRETAYPAQTDVIGAISTNIGVLGVQYGARGDKYKIVCSTATNGVIQILGKLWKLPPG